MDLRRPQNDDEKLVKPCTIVFDPGSTHCGKKDYAFRLIELASEAGADAIKFQLFPKTPEFTASGNIPMSYDWFPELVRYASKLKRPIIVSASVFDFQAVELVNRYRPPFIKFAYSQRGKKEWIEGLLSIGATVVVSTDVMHRDGLQDHKGLIKLFCQPIYPTMHKTHFENLFPNMFWGFSDHSLGIQESVDAVKAGAKWIEKHITLPYLDCLSCPDGKFALSGEEAANLVKEIRAWEKQPLSAQEAR